MTRERDIERVLDAWLEPGPRQAPDRVLLAITDRIDHVPQRRFPSVNERFHHMTPMLKLTAAAVLAIAIGIVLAPLASPNILTAPTPSPSPAPTLLSEGLRYRWSHVPLLDAPAGQAIALEFAGEDSLTIADGLGLHLWQHVALAEAGVLDLTLFPGLGGCGEAEDATYSYHVSPGGTKLTLTAEVDRCADRAAILVGDYQRDSCTNSSAPCLGPMEAGTYVSMRFAPGLDPSPKVGGLQVLAPGGWANPEDSSWRYLLVGAADLATGDFSGAVPYDGIDVFARPGAANATTCGWSDEPGVGTSMDELVAWIVAHPGLDPVTPVKTTIGDRPATVLDLALSPDWTGTCPELGVNEPVVALLTEAGQGEGYVWGVGLDAEKLPGRQRLILLDVGNGQLVDIWIGTANASELDAFIKLAMPVVETMRFNP